MCLKTKYKYALDTWPFTPDVQNSDSSSTFEAQTSTVSRMNDLAREENSDQDTFNRMIPHFPQSLEKRIHQEERMHQLLKADAIRRGRPVS